MTFALALMVNGCMGPEDPKPDPPGGDSPVDSADPDDTVDSHDSAPPDADGDGYAADSDCNDADPTIHPGATETCNGTDDDCDGAIDEDVPDAPEWHVDADGDGYGATVIQACEEPPNVTTDETDCDDQDPEAHPGAVEWCGDGVDQDCDGGEIACGPAVEVADIGTVVLGDDPAYILGYNQIGAGDLNGDGLDDLEIGTPELTHATAAGHAYVLSSPLMNETTTASASALLRCGDSPYPDSCGWGVAAVGDVDGDGTGDVVIGEPGYWSDTAAFLYHGPVESVLDVRSAATVWTRAAGTGLGGDIVGGDLDGDGLADVVIGDSEHDSGSAAALVFHSPLAETIREDDADARLFAAEQDPDPRVDGISIRGDVDGDGYPDLLYGRPWEGTDGLSGAAYLYRGPFGGDRYPADADAVMLGQAGEALGMSADICRDQNGDGRDEVVLGSGTGGDYARAVYVMLGPVRGALSLPGDEDAALVGRIFSEAFGTNVECLGDLDGDGVGDIAVTSVMSDSGGVDSGAAFLFFGPFLGVRDAGTADLEIRGGVGDHLGSITGSGDVDGDGITDLLLGATHHGAAGAVYTISGARLVELAGR